MQSKRLFLRSNTQFHQSLFATRSVIISLPAALLQIAGLTTPYTLFMYLIFLYTREVHQWNLQSFNYRRSVQAQKLSSSTSPVVLRHRSRLSSGRAKVRFSIQKKGRRDWGRIRNPPAEYPAL